MSQIIKENSYSDKDIKQIESEYERIVACSEAQRQRNNKFKKLVYEPLHVNKRKRKNARNE